MCSGGDTTVPLLRSAYGTYIGQLSVKSEKLRSSLHTSAVMSSVTSVSNMTFLMEFEAMTNTSSLGVDCTINATIVSCSVASHTSHGKTVAPHDCINSCTLALFNNAHYTATFSQSQEGAFERSTFKIKEGVVASAVFESCAQVKDVAAAASAARNLLMLLAQQVDTRWVQNGLACSYKNIYMCQHQDCCMLCSTHVIIRCMSIFVRP